MEQGDRFARRGRRAVVGCVRRFDAAALEGSRRQVGGEQRRADELQGWLAD